MMDEDEDILSITTFRYLLKVFIENMGNVLEYGTNDIRLATSLYETKVSEYTKNMNNYHYVISLYDYDKNANINYYDNQEEIS